MTRSDLALIAETRAALRSGQARTARLAAGLHLTEVAAVLGVTGPAVHHWETGRSVPSAPNALAYGKLLRGLVKGAALAGKRLHMDKRVWYAYECAKDASRELLASLALN